MGFWYFSDCWPPCSPDLNPFGFYIGPEMAREIYQIGERQFKTDPIYKDA